MAHGNTVSLQLHPGDAHSRVKLHMASVFTDFGDDVVSVASNHAMDWREEALLDTIDRIAKAVIGKAGVQQTSFLPVLIDKQLRPEVLKNGDARFADAVRFMDWISEDFEHTFAVEGDEVVVARA